jgi:alkanesulfonate monooxygenase SsuD/methylene tetrahydromethanopterin reductase-like flavin-dependent oxidoreductase (luciferase family)
MLCGCSRLKLAFICLRWLIVGVATLDLLSGGRVLFGVGGGWNRPEMENHGTAYATRFQKLEEQLQALVASGPRTRRSFDQFVDFDRSGAGRSRQRTHP